MPRVRTPVTPRRKDSLNRKKMMKANEYKEKSLRIGMKREPDTKNKNLDDKTILFGTSDPYFIPLNKISEGDFFTVYLICRNNQRNIEHFMENVKIEDTSSNISDEKRMPMSNLWNHQIHMNDIVRRISMRKEEFCTCSNEKYHSALKISKFPITSPKEIQILTELRNFPFLLHLRNAWISNELLYIETDFYNLGSLTELIDFIYIKMRKQLSDAFINNIVLNMLNALDVLETKNILHCDISPTNIFLRIKSNENDKFIKKQNNESTNRYPKQNDCKRDLQIFSLKQNTPRSKLEFSPKPNLNQIHIPDQTKNIMNHSSNILDESNIMSYSSNILNHSNILDESSNILDENNILDRRKFESIQNKVPKQINLKSNKRMSNLKNFKLLEEISEYLEYKNIAYDFNSQLQIVLGDFNISKYIDDRLEMEGTPRYMPIEALDGQYDYSSDLFSMSLIWLEMKEAIVLPLSGQLWHDLRKGLISLRNMSREEREIIFSFLNNQKRPSREEFRNVLL